MTVLASIFIPPQVQYIDANGQPIVGGKVYTYENLTSNPKASYTDATMSTQNPNPVLLDAAGRASIWISGAYSIRVTDANNNPVYTADNVISYDTWDFTGLTASIADLNSTTTSGIYVTTDYTILLPDRGKTVLANAASNLIYVTLPDVNSVPNAFKVCIKKIDFSVNTVNLITSTGELIDGIQDFKLYDYGDFIEVLADGSQWRIVASQQRGSFITITSDTTLDLSYNKKTIFCDTSNNAITVRLPAISAIGNSFDVCFKVGPVTTNYATVVPNAPSLIDGNTQLVLSSGYESVTIKSHLVKNNWYITDSNMISGQFVTGDIKPSLNYGGQPAGWAKLYDDNWTVGNAASGAHYASAAFHDLFIVLYNYPPEWCPVSPTRTGNAENDWNSNYTIMFPPLCGRVIGVEGNSRTGLSSRPGPGAVGEERHTLNESEMPSHRHTVNQCSYGAGGGGGGWDGRDPKDAATNYTGGGQSHNNMQPTFFMDHFIKL